MRRLTKNIFSLTILLTVLVSMIIPVASFGDEEEENDDYDVFYFGRYEQDNDLENGEEPIEWFYLDYDEENERFLLISNYILDYQPYHTKKESVTWANSSLRHWLNNEFYNSAFTPEEQECIVEVKLQNGHSEQPENVKKWEPGTGSATSDKVFLLSYTEVLQYFSATDIGCTYYAESLGEKESKCPWYTRSSGKNDKEATYFNGSITPQSSSVTDKRGIIPAIWVDANADYTALPYELACVGDYYRENEDYYNAYQIYDQLGTYWSSEILSLACRYGYALEALENSEYDEAYDRFAEYKQYAVEHDYWYYNDYAENAYELGTYYMNSKNYSRAIEIFSEINQYSDSMDKLYECFKETNTEVMFLTKNHDAAVNAGKNYDESNEIKSSDPHYGWNLGRFLLSGYTEAQNNNGVYTFVKTPGDSLVLWFDLNQDIDCLNGNENLFVDEHEKGKDLIFKTDTMNMGRGTLLVRHTDYQNSDSDPQIYVDYLAAKEASCADTRIEINEEGTYEVALDYKVTDSELLHKLNQTNYYRISFKFVVKNGSGMFYMLDLGTGSEIDDYSRTSKGFRIDLVNSHSETVYVERYSINQSGTALDMRAPAAAKDGEEYTQTGYYEITCKNTQTNREITKHIFVGSSEDLNEYQALDSRLNQFR